MRPPLPLVKFWWKGQILKESDIRDLADRSVGETVTQLRPLVQALPLTDGIETTRQRAPQIVVREHANNAVRWKAGERLNHLIEEVCIRFADSRCGRHGRPRL